MRRASWTSRRSRRSTACWRSTTPRATPRRSIFGRLVRERPVAVLRPGSVRDLARVLRFARRHDLRIAIRGRAHSVHGETLIEGGIVFDMSTLREVHRVAHDVATVDAGCSWSDVLDATLPAGLTPLVLPDYPGLSVGGTLSLGGISPRPFATARKSTTS